MSIKSVMPSNHLIPCHPLLLLPSIFPSNKVFPNESVLYISWPKYWSFSFSIGFPSNIQGWFLLGLTGWISLQSKGLSRVFSDTTVQKHQFLGVHLSLYSNSHIYTWLLEKPQFWLDRLLSAKHCLCFLNMLSRLVITFLPRSNRLLISWLQSSSNMILEPKKIKSLFPLFSPSICHEVMELDAMILVFPVLNFKPVFFHSLSPSSRGSLVPLHFLSWEWYHLCIWGCWYFSQQSWF